MTIRVLVADDEPLARRALGQLLAAHPDVRVVGECADGEDARAALARETVDVVFLDVRMPGRSGLDVAALLAEGPLVVFVTAHDEFALPAFDRGAVDYLLKPVTQERLDVALRRVRARLAAEADAARFREQRERREEEPPEPRHVTRLIARVADRDVVIPVDEVELIVADDVYAAVHARGRRWLVRTPLDELARALPPERFVRVHRSYIVALDAVVALRRDGTRLALELRNGASVPVSRRRRGELARLEATAARG